MQLQHLPNEWFSAHDRGRKTIRTFAGCGGTTDVSLQQRGGTAPVLPHLRHQVLLRAPVTSRRLQCQCKLPGPVIGSELDGGAIRRRQLGAEYSKAVADKRLI